MSATKDDQGQHDASLAGTIANAAGKLFGTAQRKLHPVVEQYAQLFRDGLRVPVLRRPSDIGLDYEDCFFPSLDGTALEAWFIPAASDRLLIINHPMTCNRYGFPGHIPPWNTMFGGFEVNFLPELKHLHDAGYNILTYDFRNHGLSAQANGGINGVGLLECRDVVGSLHYARSRKDTSGMRTGLFSRCMGGNATIIAMSKWPEEFTDIEALAVINVVSARTFIEKEADAHKLDREEAVEELDQRLRELTGFRLDEESPLPHAHAVKVPTLMAQLRRDFMIHAEQDGQLIFNAFGAKEKELLWVEESDQRYYAYNHFGRNPERLISWFDEHMR